MAKTNGTNGNGHKRSGRAKIGHNSIKGLKGVRYYPTYKYNWIDKDPVIDRVARLVEDEGIELSKLATIARISKTTFHNWFEGETKRPQYATIAATVGALGYITDFVKERTVNYDREYTRAAAEIAAMKEKVSRQADRAERRAGK